MADLILHKRSSTASAVPSAGSIALGELAINTADGRLFLKKVDGTVVDVTSIPGIAGLESALAGKEPSLPAGGNSGHYLRGDKTWGVTGTAVRTAALTGLGTGSNTPIAATDTVLAAFAGLQAQVSAREPAITAGTGQQYIGGDKVLRDFGTVSRAVALTGLGTPTNTAIAAADTILAAFAKLQGQVTARMTNPMTTAGDMIRGGTSGAPERVAAGTNGHVWTIVSGVPVWAAPSGGADAKQLCTAWVNFNGTGTVAIRDSYNVSSITDNGTGDYTVNFATPMDNANYSASFSGQDGVGGAFIIGTLGGQWNTAGVRFNHRTGAALYDSPILVCQVFGGKA